MKKLAIFVEGQTEQIFTSKLLIEIAGKNNIIIQKEKAVKGKKGKRYFTVIEASSEISDQEFFVLIRDCASDSTVKSDIKDSVKDLSRKQYEKIIGIRDVYPIPKNEIPLLEAGMGYGVPTKYMPINIILSVMEIEAWFLAETNHYSNIYEDLTIELIKNNLGIDLTNIDVEDREHPSSDLNDIYHLVGLAYTKEKNRVERTVEALDYSNIYLELPDKVSKLKVLIDEINLFMEVRE